MDDQRSLSGRDLRTGRLGAARPVAWAFALILGAGFLLFWLVDRPAPPEPNVPRAPEPERIAQPPSIPSPVPPRIDPPPIAAKPASTALALPEGPEADASHPAEELIAGPHEENLVPGAKPHPITAEHLRRYREVGIIESTYEALEARDFAKARELIAEHRRDNKGEGVDLEEGLSLLADCMESPSAETRARAQRFYDEETYSTTRRRIRRWCLEK